MTTIGSVDIITGARHGIDRFSPGPGNVISYGDIVIVIIINIIIIIVIIFVLDYFLISTLLSLFIIIAFFPFFFCFFSVYVIA